MTKKDYELLASEIHSRVKDGHVPNDVFNSWVDLTADIFRRDNPRFDAGKYKEACYEGKHIRQNLKA